MSRLDDLQCTWVAVEIVDSGELVENDGEGDTDDDPRLLIQFEGSKAIIGDEYAAWHYEVVVGVDAIPNAIDLLGSNLVSRTDEDPYHRRGIYRIEGEELLLCLTSKDSDTRPSSFASTPENRFVFYRLQKTNRRIE